MSHHFEQIIDQFLEGYFRFNPTMGTDLGLHQFDPLLEDRSPGAVQDEIKRLKGVQEQLQSEIDPARFSREQRTDYEVLRLAVAAELLQLREIRLWQRSPSYYLWLASGSIYSLLIRDYAPLEQRLRAVVERERAIPALLKTGSENLRSALDEPGGVPKIWIEICLEDADGAKSFFRTVVPALVGRSSDAALSEQVVEQNQPVLEALEEMIMVLRREVLDRARGDFALGADRFERLLRFSEAVETPVSEILARGQRELGRTQREMRALGRRIDPDLSLEALIKKLARHHAQPDDVVPSYRRRVDAARQFVIDRDLVTIPDGELLVVETPPFLRSLLFAALDPPGPFEPNRLPTYFYLTPTEPDWSESEQEEYLRQHNHYSQMATIFHEAYPGHYVQCGHCQRTPSRLRRVFMSGTFVEGWGHYCEQLMVEEGFGADDPKLRLFQLHEALWRIGRLLAATRMQTQGMTFEEAVEFLVGECYQERANAIREVKRYTTDPLVLIYSWGKWQIQDLRQAYRTKRGAAFSLREFHDRLLGQGEPPVSLLRRLLLEEEVQQ